MGLVLKLLTFLDESGREQLGILQSTRVLVTNSTEISDGMQGFIEAGPTAWTKAQTTLKQASENPAQADWLPLEGLRVLAPIPRPRKNVFCVGRNYKEHIIEMARSRGIEPSFPKVPEFFSKPITTVVGHEADVERHAKNTNSLDYEVEIGVVIGKRIRDVTEQEALAAVFGYTVINDITARDAQRAHGQFFKGKSFDSTCPIGPCIVTADEYGDPAGHALTLKINGEIRQNSNTSDLLFSVPQIIASLSAALTLEPGDIIATGTPSGVAQGMTPPKWLDVGDVVEAEVEGIGILRNRIVP